MLLSTESLDVRLVLGRFSFPKRLRVESFCVQTAFRAWHGPRSDILSLHLALNCSDYIMNRWSWLGNGSPTGTPTLSQHDKVILARMQGSISTPTGTPFARASHFLPDIERSSCGAPCLATSQAAAQPHPAVAPHHKKGDKAVNSK
jgi:hypothetical protein